jgi:hypothetical protein
MIKVLSIFSLRLNSSVHQTPDEGWIELDTILRRQIHVVFML